MLTDYERYQLEWMIEHGHSLKEFVRSIDPAAGRMVVHLIEGM